jgi:hypothetical protein
MITLNKRFVAQIALALLITGVLVLGIQAIEAGYLKSTFQTIGVYPEKEHFTSLFFTDVESLEQDYTLVKPLRKFIFGIHNEEERDQDYVYTLAVTTKDASIPVKSGILFIKAGETTYVSAVLRADQYPIGSMVSATLPTQGKTINFKLK